jgi:hypothetical protein
MLQEALQTEGMTAFLAGKLPTFVARYTVLPSLLLGKIYSYYL